MLSSGVHWTNLVCWLQDGSRRFLKEMVQVLGICFFYMEKSNTIFANIDPFLMPDSANESSTQYTMRFVSQIQILRSTSWIFSTVNTGLPPGFSKTGSNRRILVQDLLLTSKCSISMTRQSYVFIFHTHSNLAHDNRIWLLNCCISSSQIRTFRTTNTCEFSVILPILDRL